MNVNNVLTHFHDFFEISLINLKILLNKLLKQLFISLSLSLSHTHTHTHTRTHARTLSLSLSLSFFLYTSTSLCSNLWKFQITTDQK
jgi:hypothetical protein